MRRRSPGYLFFTSSMWVVSRFDQDNGVSATMNRTCYRYEDAMLNAQGRGFQGFKTIVAEEQLAARSRASRLPVPATTVAEAETAARTTCARPRSSSRSSRSRAASTPSPCPLSTDDCCQSRSTFGTLEYSPFTGASLRGRRRVRCRPRRQEVRAGRGQSLQRCSDIVAVRRDLRRADDAVHDQLRHDASAHQRRHRPRDEDPQQRFFELAARADHVADGCQRLLRRHLSLRRRARSPRPRRLCPRPARVSRPPALRARRRRRRRA